ncbi:MAG: autotransporter-associated beta strand repeat-containing protein [Chthoniobacter sp.]|nr:autotransporter-associated beta strand repeat-containing protein [Chthoniobacter sp.]
MLPSKRFICSRSIVWFLLAVGVVSAGKVCADQTFDQTNPNKVWDTTTKNWDASADVWLNDGTSNAIFTGTGQTLDVNDAINVNNITFNSNGWNIGDASAPSGSLTLGAPSTITVTNSTDTATLGVSIVGGALTKAGAGTLVLSGTNTFTGNVIVSTGILKIANNSALGDTTGTTSVTSGASLVLTNGVTVTGETIGINGSGINSTGALQADAGASATWAGTITIDSQGGRVGAQSGGTLTISGVIQNGASNPTGVLAIGEAPGSSTPGVVIISGTSNTYSGATQIVRGVLKLGANNALPATTTVDVSSSTSATEDCVFDLNGFSQTITGLQRTNTIGAGFVTNNGAAPSTLTITGGANPFTGVIKDGTSTVAITKSGTGTLTLAGANTYYGSDQCHRWHPQPFRFAHRHGDQRLRRDRWRSADRDEHGRHRRSHDTHREQRQLPRRHVNLHGRRHSRRGQYLHRRGHGRSEWQFRRVVRDQ